MCYLALEYVYILRTGNCVIMWENQQLKKGGNIIMKISCTVLVWPCWAPALQFVSRCMHTCPTRCSSVNNCSLLCFPLVVLGFGSCTLFSLVLKTKLLTSSLVSLWCSALQYQSAPQAINFFSYANYKMVTFIILTIQTGNRIKVTLSYTNIGCPL